LSPFEIAMRKPNLTVKRSIAYLLVLITALGSLQSCNKKSHSDISKVIYGVTMNPAFKNLNSDTFAVVLKKTLDGKRSTLNNPNLITSFYEHNGYEPTLVMQHLPKGELKVLPEYLGRSDQHGLDLHIFKYDELNALVQKIYSKDAIKTAEDAYQSLADLELMTANSLLNYSNALQFGVISPRKIYARYYTETKRPDSASMQRVFSIKNLRSFLDSIQPKDPQYLALQKALASGYVDPKMNKEETQRVLTVNLERLRWKNKPNANKYILVNIADYRLDVIDHGKSVLNMKVVVGEGRNKDFTDNLQEYDENDLKKDRPFTRETPQLNSMVHSVQVNPVWNIPQSIATNEITKLAAEDPYYLSNHNIDVYKDGKMIEDPETIDWTQGDPGKTYSFKQRPGDDNALGKIKFLFNNQSSVYLHDTPAKAGFDLPVRALSHGCVRLEKPMELALALFGEGPKYELIKKEMSEPNPDATTVVLPKKVPVFLTYFTAWADESGSIQVRKDVYGLDIVLYTYLQRLSGR
jgi:murein L,D-transpeptidase YcbB/YkuD